ncbi:hypothetical protein C8A03DRAFT_46071 [Achaetomium macrosporum]|uniref:Uncharacterized protein n=1 Tax=Achaetomium macrosporum TaxID=79813 RepID=A0AAN7HC51_9PEZI|nr:hypothetical protein C8A03DRAFT_46071 [Achaetomium macrosporum]
MAPSQERYITDPAQLQELDLAGKLSDLNLADDPVNSEETTTRHAAPRLRLALLQPLADPAMFAACRNPAPKTIQRPDGRVREVIGHEYLDISALDKAWRHALTKAPPASHITFDLRLPKSVGDTEAVQQIYWDTAMPMDGQHFGISARNVMRLVAAIAIVARVRVQGEVHFGLSYDKAEGVSTRAMDSLSKQLEVLARPVMTDKLGWVGRRRQRGLSN